MMIWSAFRCIAICSGSLRRQMPSGPSAVRRVVAFIWLSSLALMSPILLYQDLLGYPDTPWFNCVDNFPSHVSSSRLSESVCSYNRLNVWKRVPIITYWNIYSKCWTSSLIFDIESTRMWARKSEEHRKVWPSEVFFWPSISNTVIFFTSEKFPIQTFQSYFREKLFQLHYGRWWYFGRWQLVFLDLATSLGLLEVCFSWYEWLKRYLIFPQEFRLLFNTLALFAGCYLVPLGVITVSYLLIYATVWRRTIPGEHSTTTSTQKCPPKNNNHVNNNKTTSTNATLTDHKVSSHKAGFNTWEEKKVLVDVNTTLLWQMFS